MKNRLVIICLFLAGISLSCYGSGESRRKTEGNMNVKQVLIVGLPDNVKSNYFYKGMIAEETGMKADSIDCIYNDIIARNIAASCKENSCRFISTDGMPVSGQIIDNITVNGDDEATSADLSAIPAEVYQKELQRVEADYLLVINRHYLKWQEEPFRTLFHIVSYTLFDKDKNELYSGNNYFTSMNLEGADKLSKASRKSGSKIASSILKTIDTE